MSDAELPIEDTFGDILHKAMRGNRIDRERLAAESGIASRSLAAWLKDDGVADEAQTRSLAGVLHLDPAKLLESAAASWYPAPVDRADIRRHSQRPHPSNGYVFVLRGSKRAALVDPAGNPQHLLRVLHEGNYELEYILITHKHADHCDAARDVAAAYPQAQIVMHPLDVHAIGPELAARTLPVHNGGELIFGDAHITMLHTPGHTDGSACFLFESALFTGDTLFAGSVGAALGDKSTYADILESVRDRIFTLPGDTVMMPGHGPPTTLAVARAHNPFFST
jgi:hydroxyacylglutathione hydrolase